MTLPNSKSDWALRATFFECYPIVARNLNPVVISKLIPFTQQVSLIPKKCLTNVLGASRLRRICNFLHTFLFAPTFKQRSTGKTDYFHASTRYRSFSSPSGMHFFLVPSTQPFLEQMAANSSCQHSISLGFHSYSCGRLLQAGTVG